MEEIRYRLKEIVGVLEARAIEMDHRRSRMPMKDVFGRGTYAGWVAATRQDIDILNALRDELAVGEVIEEEFDSLAEKEAHDALSA